MIHPVGPHARAPVVGWEAVRRSFEEAWPRFEEFSVTVDEPMQVRVGERGAVVVAVTPVRTKMRGGETLNYTALATSAFERRDGRWLLVVRHASRVPQR
jgi:ketosteroid isomerase-like protein